PHHTTPTHTPHTRRRTLHSLAPSAGSSLSNPSLSESLLPGSPACSLTPVSVAPSPLSLSLSLSLSPSLSLSLSLSRSLSLSPSVSLSLSLSLPVCRSVCLSVLL